MELSIQERLKDLRVERGLTLEQLEEQVNLSKSALGSYPATIASETTIIRKCTTTWIGMLRLHFCRIGWVNTLLSNYKKQKRKFSLMFPHIQRSLLRFRVILMLTTILHGKRFFPLVDLMSPLDKHGTPLVFP